jgi:hypothetical protein
MTLMKELIAIPERVYQGDFVLKLSEGVLNPRETVRNYVVTDQLVGCFDSALNLIREAVAGRTSKACYLHGSFGSGKSHFMAILHLLLHGDADARSIAKLAGVVSKHNAWTEGKRFLLVPYHMIGAASMESAILGGYARHVARLHPEAGVPAVYKSENLLTDARNLRETMGDALFFGKLNSGTHDSGWGDLDADWDAASFEKATRSAPGTPERDRLVSRLMDTLLTSYRDAIANDAEAFIDLDAGLSVISRHAKELGYDALILFLDELVLWLASRAGDAGFVHREGQKLAKLVEAQTANRPVPIVGFVARQRDLREFMDEHLLGAEQEQFSDALRHWEGRFAIIRLEDRNLPAIAAERVLKPVSDQARRAIDQAFEATARYQQDVADTLMTSTGDRGMFRQVYPFSPALIDTLVAVSSMLQRERTALKVMLELLSEQRDTLQLGDIVPVGDLWDHVSTGDEAYVEEMRRAFDSARKLYREQLLPMLEQNHQLRKEDLSKLPRSDPKASRFRADERILKTLLLAALVPQVEAFRSLTARKIAALNHGTIRTTIPGREGAEVLRKCRDWTVHVGGKIRIADDANDPQISLELSGIDADSLLDKVKSEDNAGNRNRKVKDLLAEQMGLERVDGLLISYELDWRGTRRDVDVLFGNVREIPDSSLQQEGTNWKLVIDYPLDKGNLGPVDDVQRLERFRGEVGGQPKTIAWVPAFLSRESQQELGKLVLLDHALAPERFSSLAADRSPGEREAVRQLLENQRSQLKQKLIRTLQAAYGIADITGNTIDTSHNHTSFVDSLDPAFRPQTPIGATLGDALKHLMSQALDHQYPAHPRFGENLTPGKLRKVWGEVQKAIQSPDGRLLVEPANKPQMKQIAEPLLLGEMHETHFVLSSHWKSHFQKCHARDGHSALQVKHLAAWTDEPKKMGLTREVLNLVILTFAEQTNRSFFLHGGPAEPKLEDLRPELELREQALPSKEAWEKASKRAATVLGVTASPLLNASNLSRFATDVRTAVAAGRRSCGVLLDRLERHLQSWQLAPADTSRYQTAFQANSLLEKLAAASSDASMVQTLASAPGDRDAALGTSIAKAEQVVQTLGQESIWTVFAALSRADDAGRKSDFDRLLQAVRDALAADEHAVALSTATAQLHQQAVELLAPPRTPPVRPPPPPLPPPPVNPPGVKRVRGGTEENLDAAGLKRLLEDLDRELKPKGRRATITWQIHEQE